ncbi:hypothetical protein, partial [Paenibacillus prosopidis]
MKLKVVLMTCAAALICVGVIAIRFYFSDDDPVFAEFGPSVMYTTPSGDPGPGALYGRALRLQHSKSANGTMLATFEQYV